MSEELQTRTEFSRSVEDADKYRAIETLKEVGLLVPVTELETFHGRVGTKEAVDEWAVDPNFANGYNDSGNYNVNHRPTLYTGEKQVAEDFAQARGTDIVWAEYRQSFKNKVKSYTPEERLNWLDRINKANQEIWEQSTPDQIWPKYTEKPIVNTIDDLDGDRLIRDEARRLEDAVTDEEETAIAQAIVDKYDAEVHEIVTADTDVTVLDFGFDVTKLDDESRSKYTQALRALAIPVTEGSPVSFNDRAKIQPFVTAMNKLKKNIVLQDEVAAIAEEAGIDEATALQLASAFNARQAVQTIPAYLVSDLIGKPADIIVNDVEVNGEKQKVPLNMEYVQRFLRHAHIVGVKQSVSSATLNRDITSISFFDLEKTTTAKGLEKERQTTWKKLGEMATALDGVVNAELQPEHPLLKLLEDTHAKPKKLVAAAKQIEGYQAIFDADAGNWEGFTLAEHTETVLRNFDESYAENLPVQMLAPMRLAILAHDTGKPIAAANGEKYKEKEYNVAQADDFFDKLGVDEKLKDLLLAVIGDGEELAFQIDIRKAGDPAEKAMRQLAVNTLQRFYGSEEVTDEQIAGFTEMCRMLQICDGGAYTSMAVTSTANGRYRNAPSFNGSFAQPAGFGKRTVTLREEGKAAAASNLAPQSAENQSRLIITHRGAGRKAPKLSTE